MIPLGQDDTVTRISYRDALRETTAEALRSDETVYLIGEDVGRWGNLFGASAACWKSSARSVCAIRPSPRRP